MSLEPRNQPELKDFFANALLGISFFIVTVAAVYLIVTVISGGKAMNKEKPSGLLDKIQLEVLNGCGEKGVASVIVDSLRNRGFDVIQSGNYYFSDLDKTILVARRGITPKVKKLASELGIAEHEIVLLNNKQYYLDASLILGRNYRKLSFLKVQ